MKQENLQEINKLFKKLQELKELYQEFLEVLLKEREMILNNKLDNYIELLNTKNFLAEKIDVLNKQLDEIFESVRNILSLNEIKIPNIIEKLPEEEKEKLRVLSKNLKVILEKVLEENKINMEIIENRIKFSNQLLKIIESSSSKNLYSNNGEKKTIKEKEKKIIDRRV